MPTDSDTLLDSLILSPVRVSYDCDRHTALDVSYTESTLDYVLITLRLNGLARLNETNQSYYN